MEVGKYSYQVATKRQVKIQYLQIGFLTTKGSVWTKGSHFEEVSGEGGYRSGLVKRIRIQRDQLVIEVNM